MRALVRRQDACGAPVRSEAGRSRPRGLLASSRRRAAALIFCVIASGCESENPTEPIPESIPETPEGSAPPPPPAPPSTSLPEARDSIVIVAGFNQQGMANEALAEPLVVAVRDSAGRPVPYAVVLWDVVPGTGRLSGGVEGPISPKTVTLTDGAGLALVTFTPMRLGWNSATATLSTTKQAVTFHAYTTGITIQGYWGSGWAPKNLQVPVGTPIEWVMPYDILPESPHIVSTEVPPGGAAIDTQGHPWDRYRFVPMVRGVWSFEYRYRDPDTESIHVDGPYTITAQ